MKKIISIGSALVDIFIFSKDFEIRKIKTNFFLCQSYDSKIELDGWQMMTGGGATNTSVGFARLGFEAKIIAETGKDFLAQLIIQDLKNNKVNTQCLIREKKEITGGSAILVGGDGGRTIMINRGASACLDDFDINQELLKTSDWLHLSSINGKLSTLQRIFELVKKYKIPFSFNPGRKELTLIENKELSFQDIGCKILIMNNQEWQLLQEFWSQILSLVEVVIITNGKKGGEVFSKKEQNFSYNASLTQSKEDTGAGDAFCVGVVAGYLSSKTLKEAVLWGSLNAGSVVSFVGAKTGLLTKSQLEFKLKEMLY